MTTFRPWLKCEENGNSKGKTNAVYKSSRAIKVLKAGKADKIHPEQKRYVFESVDTEAASKVREIYRKTLDNQYLCAFLNERRRRMTNGEDKLRKEGTQRREYKPVKKDTKLTLKDVPYRRDEARRQTQLQVMRVINKDFKQQLRPQALKEASGHQQIIESSPMSSHSQSTKITPQENQQQIIETVPEDNKHSLSAEVEFTQEELKASNLQAEREKKNKKKKQRLLASRQEIWLSEADIKQLRVRQKSSGDANEITYSTISQLYRVCDFQDLTKKIYIQPEGEDPFFFEVYTMVINFARTEMLKPRDDNLCKIKNLIVRRVLDDFVYDTLGKLPDKEKQDIGQLRRRMTKQDKANYESIGLQPPKSRIERAYLNQLFKSKAFSQYYKAFVSSARLINYLKYVIQSEIDNFQIDILKIQKLDLSAEQKMHRISKISRPFGAGNLQQYESEAQMVLINYYHK